MSDIDDRLRSYAERWRAAQPAPPPLPALRAARRWMPVTAVAAAVAAILGVAAVVVRQEGQDVTTATVVPWKAIPQGYYSKMPLPRDCRPSDVAIRAELGGPGRAARGLAWFRSTAAEPCTLRDVGMDLRSGGSVPLDAVSVPDVDRLPRILSPGREAVAEIEWVAPYCGKQLDSVVLVVRLAGSDPVRAPVDWNLRAPDCVDEPRRTLFRHRPILGGSDVPAMGLVPRMEVPGTVRSGEPLRYRLVLENPTSAPVPLHPCPEYVHWLEPEGSSAQHDDRGGRLNCEAAPAEVPAGGAVRFEMELHRVSVPEGRYDLVVVRPGTSENRSLRVPVTVSGRVPAPPAEPCDVTAYALAGGAELYPDRRVNAWLSVYNTSARACDASGLAVRLVTPEGADVVSVVGEETPGRLEPGESRSGTLTWHSHCGGHTYALSFRVTVAGRPGTATVPANHADSPACRPDAPSASSFEWPDRPGPS